MNKMKMTKLELPRMQQKSGESGNT